MSPVHTPIKGGEHKEGLPAVRRQTLFLQNRYKYLLTIITCRYKYLLTIIQFCCIICLNDKELYSLQAKQSVAAPVLD